MAKVRNHRVTVIEDSTAAGLEAAVNAALAAFGEEEMVSVLYQLYNTKYTALIVHGTA